MSWRPSRAAPYPRRVVCDVVNKPTPPPSPESTAYRQYRFKVPPGGTDILLVRHGESAPSRADDPPPRLDGQDDPALAPEGLIQADLVANRLALEPIDALYVTPLQRTVQTAAPLARRLGLVPTVIPGLREVGLGEWEGGLFRQRAAELHPTAMQMFSEERWDVIPGAEPGPAFAARVKASIVALALAHPDQRIALFVHGGVIGSILCQAASSRGFAFVGADNGSISQLVVSGDRWIIRRYNDTAHLDPKFTLVAEPLI